MCVGARAKLVYATTKLIPGRTAGGSNTRPRLPRHQSQRTMKNRSKVCALARRKDGKVPRHFGLPNVARWGGTLRLFIRAGLPAQPLASV
eukprot:13041923-Alexandrium_andersonii.AAC.1